MDEFFWFAREREGIRLLRKAGHPGPWTKDPILSTFRFCNVFREDDATTQWFRKEVRQPLFAIPERVILATVAFRWFNLIETGEAIKPWLLSGWDRTAVNHSLRPRQRAGEKLFTGAYLIKSPPGKDKLTGILDCIDNVQRELSRLSCLWEPSLCIFHHHLMSFPFLGRFMAYEVVTDLRHTVVLGNAPDIRRWASAGPGAARGLSWIRYGNPEKGAGYNGEKQQADLLAGMRELLEASRDPEHWPENLRAWEMREVEHTLCEYDKWLRGHAGQRLKRKFACK